MLPRAFPFVIWFLLALGYTPIILISSIHNIAKEPLFSSPTSIYVASFELIFGLTQLFALYLFSKKDLQRILNLTLNINGITMFCSSALISYSIVLLFLEADGYINYTLWALSGCQLGLIALSCWILVSHYFENEVFSLIAWWSAIPAGSFIAFFLVIVITNFEIIFSLRHIGFIAGVGNFWILFVESQKKKREGSKSFPMENFSLITLLQEFRFLLLSFSLALIRSSKFFALFWCFGYLDSSPNEEIYLPEKNLYFDFGGILAIAASFLILKYTPLRNWRLPFSSIFCFAAALAYLFLSTSTIITLGFFLHLSELWLLLSATSKILRKKKKGVSPFHIMYAVEVVAHILTGIIMVLYVLFWKSKDWEYFFNVQTSIISSVPLLIAMIAYRKRKSQEIV